MNSPGAPCVSPAMCPKCGKRVVQTRSGVPVCASYNCDWYEGAPSLRDNVRALLRRSKP